MPEIPDYVMRAFGTVRFFAIEAEMEAFAGRWGGLDLETFRRVLNEGQGEDRLIAIFALGYAAEPGVRDLLLPFLGSHEAQERWASALVLGEMREEQAIPFLKIMLNEFLSSNDTSLVEGAELYRVWRVHVAILLGEWQKPAFAPALRQVLANIWNIIMKTSVEEKEMWFQYEDELAYALGRIGALGALLGLHIPEYGLRLAPVYLACGFLDARPRYGHLLLALQTNDELKKEVATVLEQRFGLSEEEQNTYLEKYGHDYFERQKQAMNHKLQEWQLLAE